MTLRDLISSWEAHSSNPLTEKKYEVRLTLSDAAKIAALAEMYPSRTTEQLIAELLSAALKELEGALPYVQGDNVAHVDELGDPIYEDVGPTGRFASLTRKHLGQKGSEGYNGQC